MTYRTTMLLTVGLFVAAVSAFSYSNTSTFAQSGSRYGGGTRTVQPPRQRTFEERFWNYLSEAKYTNWASLPNKSTDFYEGQSPHGDFLKLYVNRIAAGAANEFPNGSVIIKENYGPDKQTLMAVTVMYRSEGFDPENGDWYWAKFEPDGRVSTMDGKPVAGRARMCIECHGSAIGGDYVFTND